MPYNSSLSLCTRRPSPSVRSTLAFFSAPSPTHAAKSKPLPPTPGPPTLQDLRPAERLAEVVMATTSNLLNGAIFGALFGFVSGLWSARALRPALAEARANGRSWAGISAVYAGLQTASRVIRNRDDRFNSVVGACGSGAAFTAKAGPRAALQGCASFAALSYLIDLFAGGAVGERGAPLSDEDILRKKR